VTVVWKGLTEQQRLFAEEYVLDANATAAARRAGYTAAASAGFNNLKHPGVMAYIDVLAKDRAGRLEVKQDEIVRRLYAIATADINELVQYRRCACRYCWGEGHRYQWTAAEHERACYEAERANFPPPQAPGGVGYDKNADPNENCPECRGDGMGDIHVQDSRSLSPGARLLYAGVKQGRDGLEVKTHDQMRALELLGKHIGMFKDKIEHSGEITGPVLNLSLSGPAAASVVKPAEPEEKS